MTHVSEQDAAEAESVPEPVAEPLTLNRRGRVRMRMPFARISIQSKLMLMLKPLN